MEKNNEITISMSEQYALTPAGQMERQFAVTQRMAKVYTQSSIVPVTYRGDANIGNVVIAMDMANRMQVNPLMVMQNLYIVHGQPAWSSKFLIASINACGRFSPLRYEFRNEEDKGGLACRAYAYDIDDKKHQQPLCGTWITMAMARKEGWSTKEGSKWSSMPEQMLRYRAAAFWQRVYAPEISMGFYTKEEVDDGAFANAEEVTPKVNVSELAEAAAGVAQSELAEAAVDDNAESESAESRAKAIHAKYVERNKKDKEGE